MLTPQFTIPLHNELVVDLFAGGGGASTSTEGIRHPLPPTLRHEAHLRHGHAHGGCKSCIGR